MEEMMVRSILLIAVMMFCCACAHAQASHRMDLAGTWGFALDPEDVGVGEAWFAREIGDGAIALPGSLQDQGFGNDPGIDTPWVGLLHTRDWYKQPKYASILAEEGFKFPFWLQPDKHYIGPAWYQRDVEVPADWTGKRVVLRLERAHWETRVWVNGGEAGQRDSLGVPHEYDVTHYLKPGMRNSFIIRVDNRLIHEVGINSHSVTDQTQTNWNGVVGEIALLATAPVWIDELRVYPNVAERSIRVTGTIGNATGTAGSGTLVFGAALNGDEEGRAREPMELAVEWNAEQQSGFEATYALGDETQLWDEFDPAVYTLTATLHSGDYSHECRTTFGLREMGVNGTQFTLNGRRIMLRGTLECAIFPLTGYPPTDVAAWRKILNACKAHGLNHIRFHSWTPPRAAFIAADEAGIMLQIECSSWANAEAAVGEGRSLDQWLYDEGERIVREYGNHPSFCFMAYGNEPGKSAGRDAYLTGWIQHFKELDSRRLYTGGAGWPLIDANEFHLTPDPRLHRWGEGLRSRVNAEPPSTMPDHRGFIAHYSIPVVAHEIGQWCVYPNFGEIEKYTGSLKAKNFEIFRTFLERNHMAEMADDFFLASGKLQAIMYKEEIETALRTPGFGGFQLLDLHDFPGQGTALIGVLDPFWDEKPYINADEFRRFCGPTIPLARLPKRIFTEDELVDVKLEVAHFGPHDLTNTVVSFSIVHNGRAVAKETLPAVNLPTGELSDAGSITLGFKGFDAPARVTLNVAIGETDARNSWDIWVFPREMPDTPEVAVFHEVTPELEKHLAEGNTAILALDPKWVRVDAVIGFTPAFWNTEWTSGQTPHTLGLVLDPKHAAFNHYVTDFYSDWQWWEPLHGAAAMTIDHLPPSLHPIIQPIDTWFEARRLALAFEARAGGGKLLVTSMDLENDLSARPSARQLRHSFYHYAASDSFDPKDEIALEGLRRFQVTPPLLHKLGARITTDSAEAGHEAVNLIDGRIETLWHTRWSPEAQPLPHWVTIELPEPKNVAGIVFTPRADKANGRIARWRISVSDDGSDWRAPIASGDWTNDADVKRVMFARPMTTRFIRLEALSEVRGTELSSGAEIDIILE